MAKKRKHMSKPRSKRVFRKHAAHHPKNTNSTNWSYRGGNRF